MNDVKNAVSKLISQLEIEPVFQLQGPKPLMTTKTYHEKVAMPLMSKLKSVLKSTLIWLDDTIQTQQVELRETKQQEKMRISKLKVYEEKMYRESARKAISGSSQTFR